MELNRNTQSRLNLALKAEARKLLDESISLTQANGVRRHFAVHEIRKNLKKSRALLRMVRLELGEESFKAENQFLRNAGRMISEIRDAAANLETLDKMEERYAKSIKPSFFEQIRKQLKKHKRILTRKLLTEEQLLLKLREQLKNGKARIQNWPIADTIWVETVPSLAKVYKRGYNAKENVLKDPTVDGYHEWRKRVKYKMYILRLLEPAWPLVINAFERELQVLSDYLGDDHDLAVLKTALEERKFQFENKKQHKLFDSIVREHSEFYRKQAKALGRKMYAESPADFKKRYKIYLETTPIY